MSQFEKDKERIKNRPKDYSYSDALRLLNALGYKEYNKGKTSGSRVKFYRVADQDIILLHKPHPGDIMSQGAVKDLIEHLESLGEL